MVFSLSLTYTHTDLQAHALLATTTQKKKKKRPINYKNKYQNSITTVALSQNLFANKLLARVKQT